jgi:hypothetical protein
VCCQVLGGRGSSLLVFQMRPLKDRCLSSHDEGTSRAAGTSLAEMAQRQASLGQGLNALLPGVFSPWRN